MTAHDNKITHLTTRHGEVSIEEIDLFEMGYINKQCRAAQDTNMKYKALLNSMTTECQQKVMLRKGMFTVDGKLSGNLLFKVIVKECLIDTNTMTKYLHSQLQNLAVYMDEIGNKITKFNLHTKRITT